ncbi:hypothetical protein RN001_007759 [Aquatica leii]|uniref:Uncharacterized protein n=1 Tax=Aquatica leii TaxID=1421715 RepID=A0AAN7SP03_9COLE|nr:hypothetical protein RN001_007759 [Aquatica leii]
MPKRACVNREKARPSQLVAQDSENTNTSMQINRGAIGCGGETANDVLQHGLSDIMLDDPFVVVVGQVFPNPSSDVPMCDDDANTSLGDYNGCVMWVNKNQNPQNPSNRKDLDERRKTDIPLKSWHGKDTDRQGNEM